MSSLLLCIALPYIVLLGFIRGCYLAVLIVSGLLDVDYFSRRVRVDLIIATDGAAVVDERAGITFGVDL